MQAQIALTQRDCIFGTIPPAKLGTLAEKQVLKKLSKTQYLTITSGKQLAPTHDVEITATILE